MRRIRNDFSGMSADKTDHIEQGRILIVSSRGVLWISVVGLITTVAIILHLVSLPYSTINIETFGVGLISAFISLGATGFALGIYFGAAGKYRKRKNR